MNANVPNPMEGFSRLPEENTKQNRTEAMNSSEQIGNEDTEAKDQLGSSPNVAT